MDGCSQSRIIPAVLQQAEGRTRPRTQDQAALVPTPTADTLPRRYADFDTLGEALDYAAEGVRGLNFHDPRGQLVRAYTFRELRDDAISVAYRLIAHGVTGGDRIALITAPGPEFPAFFFRVVFSGALPVPLPLPTSFGCQESFIHQLSVPT